MAIGNNIIEFDTIDSTNLYMNQLIKNTEVIEGTIVLAGEQTAGRGQVNNIWESRRGENLLMSFVLYPDFLHAGSQFMLSKFVSLGIFEFLSNYLENVKIKWPNDIYVGDKKIAGVLIENSLRGASISSSIVGIGLNVNQIDFSPSIPNPSSLKIETNRHFDVKSLLVELCQNLENWYRHLKLKNAEKINSEYIKSLYRFRETSQYSDKKGSFKATITGIDESGRLCLTDSHKKNRKYAFKEVKFL